MLYLPDGETGDIEFTPRIRPRSFHFLPFLTKGYLGIRNAVSSRPANLSFYAAALARKPRAEDRWQSVGKALQIELVSKNFPYQPAAAELSLYSAATSLMMVSSVRVGL
jgi:hypothetical protein